MSFTNKIILWIKKEIATARLLEAGASKKKPVDHNAKNPFVYGKKGDK